MTLSHQGESLIKKFESCRLEAYKDIAGTWTIGYGNISYENGTRVKQGDKIAQWRAEELFKRVVQRFVNDVNYLTKGTQLTQNQFDALVSFAYNLGSDIDLDTIAEGLGDSTLLKMVLKNPENPDIPKEFLKWNKAGGKVSAGLNRRRKSEAHLYETGELNFFE
jgi:lysozyme